MEALTVQLFHKSRVSLLTSSLDASGISILSPVSSILRLSQGTATRATQPKNPPI
jgi:hypothetical protein